MKKGIIVFSLLLHILNWAQATKSLHISEIMFYPVETNGEYIELYNSSETPINLSKYKIVYYTSSADTIVPIASGTILPPNNFAIIFESDYNFDDGEYLRLLSDSTLVLQIDNAKFGSSGMANTSDRFVYLLNSVNDTIDVHQYSANNKVGFSDEKINLSGNNVSSNWSNSKLLNGTPGIRNSVSPLNFDLSITDIFFIPNNVFIDSSFSIFVKIYNYGLSDANNFVINIFNDLNQDSLSGSNEMIHEESISFLTAGDSLEIQVEYSISESGMFLISSQIDFNPDDNLQNNFFSKQIYVNAEPNNFNDIVINEIMFKPSDDQPEWVELYNKTDADINLKNWRVADKSSRPLISDTNITIEANGYIVLTESDEISSFFDLDSNLVVLNLPSLNNTGDNIKITDSLGQVIDSVNYDQSWGGSNGYSLERISSEEESNFSSNWSSSNSPNLATPGKINSITKKENDLALSSMYTQKPYATVGENFEIQFIVKNIGLKQIENYDIKMFYDSNSDLVAQEEELLETTFYNNLSINDSIMVKYYLSEFIEGVNTYIIKLYADNDDYIENNEIKLTFNAIKFNEFRNDIVINEIMHSPKSPEPEWIEIFNRSNKEINLKNYKIADKSDTSTVIFESNILRPNEYLVFSEDSSITNLYKHNINFVAAKLPNMNNTGDKLLLLDSLNRIIDSLDYLDSWGGNLGKSLERINFDVASIDSTNWTSCKLFQSGSPGIINTQSQKDYDVLVSEILFNPPTPKFKELVSISTKIINIGKENVQFNVQLFEDIDLDSTNINLVEASNLLTLSPLDSVVIPFSFTINKLISKHRFIVKAISPNEQDTTNNQLTKSILPSYIPSSIIVNEIMYSPVNGEPEWIELFNTTEDSINISDFTISDILTTPKSTKILSNKSVAPNSYILLSKDSTIADYHSLITSEIIIMNFANLNNDVDGIVLKDSFGKTIDSVKYKSSWGGTNGFSLERILSQSTSTDSSNWNSSHDIELSTPGRKNSVTPFMFNLAIAGVNTIPENPSRNEEVFVEVMLKNLGLQTIQDASLTIKFGTNNERKILSETKNIDIALNDSVLFKSTKSFVINDSVKLYISADYGADQNTIDNSKDTIIFPRTERSTVLINEFMANPKTNESEWIELYNNSDSRIDLSKWFVSDLLTTPKLVQISNESLFIEPDSFLVISNDTSILRYNLVNIAEAKFGALGNIEDGIILYDFKKEIVDSLKYNSEWTIQKGRSLERELFDVETSLISNWLPSLAVTGSTPGQSNSILETSPSTINSLVINEIMFDPDETNTEFIELYNRSNESTNIGGWKLIINEKDIFEISSTFFELKTNEYFVVASDSSIFKNYSISDVKLIHILNSGTLSLSNIGESILVLDHWNNLIDSINYNYKWHNQNIAITKNKSIERISPQMDSNEFTNWSTTVNESGGTPGKTNSVFTKNDKRTSGISFSPNPFSPDNDGFEDFSIINFSLPFNIAQLRIKIFDDHGRLVRNLVNNKAVGNKGSILFNGLDEDGSPLRIGMYIVFMEAVDLNSGKIVAFKDIIVVARKL